MKSRNSLLLLLAISFGFLAFISSAKQQPSWPLTGGPKLKQSTLPTRQLYATSGDSGDMIIDLMATSAVRVNVSFSNPDSDPKDAYAQVGIALYTSQTFLAIYGGSDLELCYRTNIYNCSAYTSCTADPSNTSTLNLRSFQVSGYYGTPNVYLAYDYWSLTTPALFVTKNTICDGEANQNMHQQIGFMGMGVAGDNRNNFISSPVFSVYFRNNTESELLYNMDYIYGDIIFDYDHGKVDTLWPWWPSPQVALPADDNWHVANISSIKIGQSSLEVKTSLIFDVNFPNAINIPSALFDQVISALNSNNLDCQTQDDYYWSCTNTSSDPLPNIEISIDSETVLSISPDVYLEGSSLSISRQAASAEYKDYIILGQDVMTYYYTVFDAKTKGDNKIKMYVANHGGHSIFYYIGMVLAWLAGMALMLVCCCCLCMLQSNGSSRTTYVVRPKKRLLDLDTGTVYQEA